MTSIERSHFIVWLICFIAVGVGIVHMPTNWPSEPGPLWMILMPLGLVGAFVNFFVHVKRLKRLRGQK